MHRKIVVAVVLLTAAFVHVAAGQARVGKDSATRLTRFGRDIAYGSVEGLGYAGIDQLENSPEEWGKGWPGYEKRVASNVGEFLIQETVSEGLAAALNRPLDYRPCTCRGTTDRVRWAIRGAYTDRMPDGTNRLAIPRIVGAYTGSFAQALWRPDPAGRLRVGLVNGTTSLAIGALIDIYHEFKRDLRDNARRMVPGGG